MGQLLRDAITRFAELFEYGVLLAETTPHVLFDQAAGCIKNLRARTAKQEAALNAIVRSEGCNASNNTDELNEDHAGACFREYPDDRDVWCAGCLAYDGLHSVAKAAVPEFPVPVFVCEYCAEPLEWTAGPGTPVSVRRCQRCKRDGREDDLYKCDECGQSYNRTAVAPVAAFGHLMCPPCAIAKLSAMKAKLNEALQLRDSDQRVIAELQRQVDEVTRERDALEAAWRDIDKAHAYANSDNRCEYAALDGYDEVVGRFQDGGYAATDGEVPHGSP